MVLALNNPARLTAFSLLLYAAAREAAQRSDRSSGRTRQLQ
jgi:hypothetical protein